MNTPLIASGLLAASLFSGATHAALPSYTFTALGTLGGTSSNASAINASGQVVGTAYTTGDATYHAVLWNGTTATDLGTLGGTYSAATGINASGQVVGWAQTGGSYQHAVLWNGTTATDLNTFSGGAYSAAFGINAFGQVAGYARSPSDASVHATLWTGNFATNLSTLGGADGHATAINASSLVGYSDTGFGTRHATLWNSTTATNLGTLGGNNSYATAINATGHVVGYSDIDDLNYFGNPYQHAFLWNGTVISDLGTLGGTYSQANAINASGQVVGISGTTGDASTHAFLWDGTTIIDLNSLLDASAVSAGWVLESASGINDNGWIVGQALNTVSGEGRAYLLSVVAVPEPEAYAMMLAGLGLVCTMAQRRKLAKV